MKKVTTKIFDLTIKIEFEGIQDWNYSYSRNTYKVTLKNDSGKRTSYLFYDSVHNTKQGIYITDELIYSVAYNISADYKVNSDNYSCYFDFASDYGYEQFDKKDDEYKRGREIYKERLRYGNKLKRVVSKEWIDNFNVLTALS